jgi:hypothetical protein
VFALLRELGVIHLVNAPKIEEIPAKCRLKIARSIDPPEWKSIEASGG